MTPNQRLVIEKSDHERIIDLVSTLAGLAVLAYTLHPEPFERVVNYGRAWVHAWVHRVSVWEARAAIRSLPETEES